MQAQQTQPLYPVRLEIDIPASNSRFWAIPLIGLLVKLFILIPHYVVLWALGIVVGTLQLVLWIPVLFGGKYPDWGYQLVGGYVRWSALVTAYLFGLTDRYPPFSLSGRP